MNKFKRMLSIILAVSMLYVMPALAEETDVITETVEEAIETTTPLEETAQYSQDYGLLKVLGILTDEDLNLPPDELVSRAQFAVYICNYSKVEPGTAKGIYKDVMKGSFEEAYIETAVSMGYLDKKDDEYFYPAYPVTMKEILCAILKLSGYTNFEEMGVDPYSQTITQRIIRGVEGGDNITRDNVYKIMYQSLFESPVSLDVAMGGVSYEADKNTTILKNRYEIEEVKGIITAAGLVGKDYAENTMLIDGTELIMPEGINPIDIVGRNVKCYYNTEKEVIYIQLHKNETVTLKADDVTYSDLTYKYNETGKKLTLDVPVVYFNEGLYTLPLTAEIMAPKHAHIELVDNDSDGDYEYVLVSSYTNHLVRQTQQIGEYYFIDYITGEVVEFETLSDVSVYNAAGDLKDFSALGEKIVVSKFMDPAGSKYKLYYSDKIITAKFNGIYKDENDREYISAGDGLVYYVSDYLHDAMANAKTEPFVKGTEYSLYLDVYDEVVYYEGISGTNRNYGIITQGYTDGMGSVAEVRMYSRRDGGFATYKLAKSVTLNGKATKNHESVIDALKYDGVPADNKTKSEEVVGQLVEFDINDAGEIKGIQQVLTEENGINTESSLFLFDDGKTTYDGAGWLNRAVQASESNYRRIATDQAYKVSLYSTANAITYRAPYNTDEAGNYTTMAVDDEQAFEMSRMGSGGTYDVKLYKNNFASEMVCAAVIKAKAGGSACPTSWETGMVDEISYGINADGEGTTILKINGTEYPLDTQFDVNNLVIFDYKMDEYGRHKLQVGDLVGYNVDALNEIYAIEPIYDGTKRVFLCQKSAKKFTNYGLGYIPAQYRDQYDNYYDYYVDHVADKYHQYVGRNDSAGDSIIYAFHLYRQEGGFMFGVQRNKSNVDNEENRQNNPEDIFSPETFDPDNDLITIIHRSSKIRYFDGEKTRIGSISDLVGFADSPEKYVDIVVDMYYGTSRKLYIYPGKP